MVKSMEVAAVGDRTAGLPLDGIRVLDATDRLGAYGGRLLADFGADVVKIEPIAGATLRTQPPFLGDAGEDSLAFGYFEANKTGIRLDLAASSSRETLKRLAENCDVILVTPSTENPVVGFDPVETLLDWAPPGAIVVAITPLGSTGPLRGWRATHLVSCAMAGLLGQQGPPIGPPQVIPGEQMYARVGIDVATTIFVALRERERSRRAGLPARRIAAELSAHQILGSTNFDLLTYAHSSHIPERFTGEVNEYGGVWDCADGEVILITTTARQWNALLGLLGRPAGLAAPEFAEASVRRARCDELTRIVRPLLGAMTCAEVVSRAQEAGVPSSIVSSMADYTSDDPPSSRGFFVDIDVAGRLVRAPGAPFRSSAKLLDLYRSAAPALPGASPAAVAERWRETSPRAAAPTHPVAPFSGMRVLSFGAALAGAQAAAVLADLGADVVKIENPNQPDALRFVAPPAGTPVVREPSGVPTSPNFGSFNRSVRSLALDMTNPEAIALFLNLVREADVLIDSFSPRVLQGWGVGHERLAEVNPQLIHVSISGYGHTGSSKAHHVAYGGTVCSFVGLTRAWGYANLVHFDYVAQGHAVLGAVAALAARDRSGEGIFIDLAMIDAAGSIMGPMVLDWTANGREPVRSGNRVAGSVWSDVLPCGGSGWIAIEAETDADWWALTGAVGWATDTRVVERDADGEPAGFRAALQAWLDDRSPFQAARLLQGAGVPAAPVQNVEDVFRDPQLRSRGEIVEVDHPDLGVCGMIAPVHRLVGDPPRRPRGAPRLGSDGDSVLEQWLRLGHSERDGLRASGAFWMPDQQYKGD
ncbi:CaiB/BaiF CoA-transferase family protein [Herbiconiux ginsengi]|uniref:Crotonobetainyl-CoA:carnitine CoA-transferase CaiB n=1 Tax=Herbiconiux ginsengi TaxID=381665 RepID=A0A1H3TGM5_9MICO|nr:CoA transferase [Herbiconiux ginsengi]SDZ49038.1 Crotonobetainyl-CoA:carnitine CoA-transferase CaiB [Herbiconiux ginsengi]